MRILLLALVALGALCGFVYPWVGEKVAQSEIHSMQVYNSRTGYTSGSVVLSSSRSPYRVYVRMVQSAPSPAGNAKTMVWIDGNTERSAVFASSVTFSSTSGFVPKIDGNEYEGFAGSISVRDYEQYTFKLRTEGLEGVPMERLDLVVRGRPFVLNRDVQTGGFVLLGIGLIGTLISSPFARSIAAFFSMKHREKDFATAAASVGCSLVLVSTALLIVSMATMYVHKRYFGSLFGSVLANYYVFDRPSGYRPFSVNLDPIQSPVRVKLNVTPLGSYQKPGSRTDLLLSVSRYGKVIYSEPITALNSTDRSVRTPETFTYDLPALDIADKGTYQFSVKSQGSEGLSMRTVDVDLRASPSPEGAYLRVAAIFTFITGVVTAWLGLFVRKVAAAEKNPRWPGASKPRRAWGRDAG